MKFFGTVRQKIVDGKYFYCPPPILSLNFFATRNFPKHSTEGFFYETFRYRETKKLSTEIRAITLWSMNVSDTRNYWKTKGFPYELSRHFETKKISTENFSTPSSHLLILKLFCYELVSETAQKGSSTKSFGTLRQKIFDKKSWHNPLKQKFFR